MQAIYVSLIFNFADVVSGLVAALRTHDLVSSKLRDGLFKKVGFVMCYALAYLLDSTGAYVGFDIGIKLLPAIVAYVCSTETVSICENICRINPDILPEKLKEMLRL